MYVIASVAPMTRRLASCPASLASILLCIAFLQNPVTTAARTASASAPNQNPIFLVFQCPNIGYGIACAPKFHAVPGGSDANGCSLPPRCVPVDQQRNRHFRRLRPRLQREP